MTELNTLFTVKCFNASQGVIYSCLTETWAEAVLTAHLVAEAFEERTNIYKPNETTHCYSVSGQPDVTQRIINQFINDNSITSRVHQTHPRSSASLS